MLPGEDPAELVTDEAIWRLLRRYGRTERQVRVLRATVYSHHVRFAARWRSGRVFLAGDAAHAMPPWIGQGMAAGVRDVGNLCWKLTAVLTGTLPESVLDSYEAERKPHVRAITRRAVLAGRIITERRPAHTRIRDLAFRVLSRIGPLNRVVQNATWIPACRYRTGFLATPRAPATGRHIPQPWTITETGSRQRLDDVLGDGWTLLHLPTTPADPVWTAAGARTLAVLPPNSPPRAGALVDPDGVLTDWLSRHRADQIVLRPDRIVYAAAAPGRQLPPPPARSLAPESAERTAS